ncbi:myo-inositol transporter 1 [Trichomonascus vanleenenianus]|uniref:myo-inositol transporter 1 n=1 Tax=Trichomonascus vanleenenianus TaxID=2268995 RepID=UPI003EC972B2
MSANNTNNNAFGSSPEPEVELGASKEEILYTEDISKAIVNADADAGFHESTPTALLWLLVFTSSVSHFMFGYDTGYISSALVSIGTDLGGKELTYGNSEFITSATSLGAFFGSAIAGGLADWFGRKWVSIGANLFLIVGAAMQCGAQTVWTMIGGRFVMGWGVGVAATVAPMYITELSPPKFRGRMVTVSSIVRTGAQLLAYAIGAGLQKPKNGWRILVGISIIPTIIQSVAMIFLPDSPRYLVQKDRLEEARQVIARTHNGASDELIDAKVLELIETTKEIYPPGTSVIGRLWLKLRELHCIPSNFRALVIVCGSQGINQFTGFNSLMYFSATIFTDVGFNNPTAVSIIVAGTNFVFTVLVYFLVDRVGRRPLMIYSLLGMIAALILAAVAFHFVPIKVEGHNAVQNTSGSGISGWGIVILVAMMLYVAFFASGVGAVPWQQSELLPMSVRGLGSSFACCTNWAGSLIIASTFLTMMEKITPTGTFAFFAAISFLSLIFVIFCFPELSNIGLEEAQELLSDGFNIKKSVKLSKERGKLHKDSD